MTDTNELGIYVDMDSMVDTRSGIVKSISMKAYERLAISGYPTRDVDNFHGLCGIDQSDYDKRWKERTADIVRDSIATRIPMVLSTIVGKINGARAEDATMPTPKITVNTFPYNFSEDERRMLEAAIACYIGVSSSITLVHIPTHTLTPNYIKSNWGIMVMYDFIGWLNMHHAALLEAPIPGVTFYAPRLRESDKLTMDDVYSHFEDNPEERKRIDKIDPFDSMSILMVAAVDLHWLEVSEYCELPINQ